MRTTRKVLEALDTVESQHLKVIYAQQDFPEKVNSSIFLAGPTPRDADTKGWRDEAVDYLNKIGYSGIVYNPELLDGNYKNTYDDQFEWEHKALDRSDIILFYIPRDLTLGKNGKPKMPAFTTNIEFGLYANSNRLIVAIPEDKMKVSSNNYIKSCCKEKNIPFFNSLTEAFDKAIEVLDGGAIRKGAETMIPLNIWKTESFQNWYQAQKSAGNELRSIRNDYNFVVGKGNLPFCWLCKTEVWIKDEDRVKSNEFVFSRSDLSSVVMYHLGKDLDHTYIVLVKEFRVPCDNEDCMVYEIPGGSSKKSKPPLEVATSEIEEETGIVISSDRLVPIASRQAMATLSAHKVHAYSVELTDEEFDEILKLENSVHGVVEDTERTYLVIKSVSEILENNLLDWSNIGMILSELIKSR